MKTTVDLREGDCLEHLGTLAENSVDCVVTDPPAFIGFMGLGFDKPSTYQEGQGAREAVVTFLTKVFTECLRVTKPGGHALVWTLPRTQHWTATALEDAGWEGRDQITHSFSTASPLGALLETLTPEQQTLLEMAFGETLSIGHVTGQGFPKGQDIGKLIDKSLGQEPEVVGVHQYPENTDPLKGGAPTYEKALVAGYNLTRASSPEGQPWSGWNTTLKPAVEHWLLVRKPLQEKTVAAQVLATGTGAINIDRSRVAYRSPGDQANATPQGRATSKVSSLGVASYENETTREDSPSHDNTKGRFPTNLIQSHSPLCIPLGLKTIASSNPVNLKTGASDSTSVYGPKHRNPHGGYAGPGNTETLPAYQCHPSCPVSLLDRQGIDLGAHPSGIKTPSPRKRSVGLVFAKEGQRGFSSPPPEEESSSVARFFPTFPPLRYSPKIRSRQEGEVSINHPTAKTQALMEWLVGLVCPPHGTVLDPFSGSGSTLVAATNLGFSSVGFEVHPDYFKIAQARTQQALSIRMESENAAQGYDALLDTP